MESENETAEGKSQAKLFVAHETRSPSKHKARTFSKTYLSVCFVRRILRAGRRNGDVIVQPRRPLMRSDVNGEHRG